MIVSTSLSMLRNLEFFRLLMNILAYLKAENLEELKLAQVATLLEERLKTYDDLLVLERGNVLSEKLSRLDQDRDQALRSLLRVVRTYVSFPDEEKADAARRILRLFEKYGKDITRLPYLEESGALVNVLQDLKQAGCQADIALLHVDDWVEKLETASLAFDELFVNRESDNSTKLTGKVKEARQQIQAAFEQLATLINAYEIVYGAEAYAGLSSKINEAVTYARDQASRRGPNAKTDDPSVKE